MSVTNSANRERQSFGARGTAYADPVLQFFLQDDRTRATVQYEIENIGSGQNQIGDGVAPNQVGNSITFKFQDSADGVAWADVAGTEDTVVPRGKVSGSVNVRRHVRLMAFGNDSGFATLSVDEPANIVLI